MKTYPYPTPDGITQLVEESEYNRLKWELEESKAKHASDVSELNARLTQQQSDMLDTIVQLRAELTSCQSMAERLATEIDTITHVIGLTPLAGNREAMQEAFDSARTALAAYESAKKGNLPDPLAEAVKRMEEVTLAELSDIYNELWADHHSAMCKKPLPLDAVRARLITAAKGEQP